jgi:hypothetical protein
MNPAHVGEQRRVQGRRRLKTDTIDLEAITELVLAGRGIPVSAGEQVIGELAAGDLHQAADRVAGQAQVVLDADLGGVLDLLGGPTEYLAQAGRGHRTG